MKRTNQVSTKKLIDIMDKVPFFAKFNSVERAQVAQCAQIYLADTGEAIIEKGASDTCFYILLNGRASVKLEKDFDAVAQVGPGSIFGEIGFILHSPRSTWIIADQICAMLRIDQSLLDKLDYATREKVKDQIILKLAKTIEAINERV